MPQIAKQFAAMEVAMLKAYQLTADNATPGSLTFNPGIQVVACQEVQFEPGQIETARWVGDYEILRIHSRVKNLKGRFVCNNVAADALAFIHGGINTQNANTQASTAGAVTASGTWAWTVPANPTAAIAAGAWTVAIFQPVAGSYYLTVTNGTTTYQSGTQAAVLSTFNFAGTAAAGLTITISTNGGAPAVGASAGIGSFPITNTSAGATTSTNVVSLDGTEASYFKLEALVPYVKDLTQEVGSNARLVIPKCKLVGGPQVNFNGNPAQTAINWECVRPNDVNSKFWAQLVFGESAQALSA